MADPIRDSEDALSLRLTAEVLAAHPTRVGDYRLVAPLGKGGMGAVYRGEDIRTGRPVAVKLILPEALADPVSRARFHREAGVQAKIKSDHVVPVYEVGEENGLPFLVLPLLRGETLDARLKREPIPPVGVTLKVAREVAEGLAAADAVGIVHRDIKPSNVWLDGEPYSEDPRQRFRRCLLLDFGLARETGVPLHRLTATQELLGTPAYMSPERVNNTPVDGRTDLFALGVILYEMATGKHPFDDPNPYVVLMNVARLDPPPVQSLNPVVPERLADLVARLIAKEADDRPASARAVADEVRAMPAAADTLADPGDDVRLTRTLPPSAAAPTVVFRRRRAWRLPVVVGGLLAALLVAVVVWAATRPGPPVVETPGDPSTQDAPVRPGRGPIALDPDHVPTAERWPGAPAELVGVIGSGARQHFGGVGLVVAHPTGKWVATLPAARPIRRAALWNPATLAPAGALDWDGEFLGHVAVSRDGRTVAAGERLGPTTVYDASGVIKPRGRLPVEATAAFAFLPDGSLLTAGAGGRFTVWDAVALRPRRTFDLPPLAFDKAASTRVQDFAVSEDGSTLAVNCANQAVRVWDIARDPPAERAALHRPGRFWVGAALAPDGKTLYTMDFSAGEAGVVRSWRVGADGVTEVGVVAREADEGYSGFAASPDGKQLAVTTLRAGVLRFALPGGAALPAIDLGWETGTAVRLAFGPDSNTLYTGGVALRAWDLSAGRPVERIPFDAASRVTDAVLAADGTLAAAHADGRVREWDLTGPAPAVRRELAGAKDTSTGRLAVNAGFVIHAGNGLTIWPRDDANAAPVRLAPTGTVADVATTPDGRLLVTPTARTLILWERRDGSYVVRAERPATGGWGRVAVSPDGKWVAAVERHAGLRLLEVLDNRLEPVPEVATSGAGVPVFSPDGAGLLVVGTDLPRPLRFQLTGKTWSEAPFPDTDAKAQEAAFLPNGRSFVTVGVADGRLDVWDWETGKVTRSVSLPGRATGLSVAIDGRHVAARSDNGTAVILRLGAAEGR